ncbi:MAG: hypothetical protein RIB59_12760 [Rhodospirillales bacterium]
MAAYRDDKGKRSDLSGEAISPFIPKDDFGRRKRKPQKKHSVSSAPPGTGKAPRQTPRQAPRQDHLGRLLVKSFEHLLADGPGAKNDPRQISRDVLPGFIMAIHAVLGPELIGKYQSVMNGVLRQYGANGHSDWGKVFSNGQARTLNEDVLTALALHLSDVKFGGNWFAETLYAFARPAAAPVSEKDAADASAEKIAQTVLQELFGALAEKLTTESGRLKYTRRYGAEICITVSTFLGDL